jgi:beta-phosphoglucomutase-like phosphatase (HAD superfamily)
MRVSGQQRPDLVIFDFDGVLIDSQVIQRRIDVAELTRLGFR